MSMPAVIAVLLILLLFIAVYLWMISSVPAGKDQIEPLLHHNYAHRGLYRKDQTVAENSLEAFLLAVAHGYAIELDVQFSSDEKVVVFHDDSLQRMCGVDAPVCSKTYAELTALKLGRSQSTIPLFTEVLDAVNGEIPIIIEIKSGRKNTRLCEKTLEILSGYQGAFCVESFNPAIVRWFKKHAKKVVRGQLSESYRDVPLMPFFLRFAFRNFLFNFLAKPHFLAMRHQDANRISFRICSRLFHLLPVAWTVRPEDDLDKIRKSFRLIIFEFFEP